VKKANEEAKPQATVGHGEVRQSPLSKAADQVAAKFA